jgi:outer membrane protein assembly factor BamB
MKLPQKIRIELSRREALVLFIVLSVLLCWIMMQLWFKKPQPRITHILGSSTQHVDVLWFKQDDISNMVAVDASGVAFMMPLALDSLIAIDITSGAVMWKAELPFERSGARGLLADQNTIYMVNATRADAYEATTGELKWSTELGYGHVSVISQLDADILRVYYGDTIIEINSKTGEILAMRPKEDATWITGNIVFRASSAYNKQTGEPLWTRYTQLDVDEDQQPQVIGTDILLVGYQDKRICALNLQTGKDNWCRPEAYISKVAVNRQSQLGYAMRDDFVLATIDLKTGNVLGETSFLSSESAKEYSGFVSSVVFSDGVVVVSFYDSGQTFGLKFSQSSQ